MHIVDSYFQIKNFIYNAQSKFELSVIAFFFNWSLAGHHFEINLIKKWE